MKQLFINNKDILIFDLDDTLYKEVTFVSQGFLGVSIYLEKKFSIPFKKTFNQLKMILKKNGRGKIFNIFCKQNNIYSHKLLNDLIKIYRFCKK